MTWTRTRMDTDTDVTTDSTRMLTIPHHRCPTYQSIIIVSLYVPTQAYTTNINSRKRRRRKSTDTDGHGHGRDNKFNKVVDNSPSSSSNIPIHFYRFVVGTNTIIYNNQQYTYNNQQTTSLLLRDLLLWIILDEYENNNKYK